MQAIVKRPIRWRGEPQPVGKVLDLTEHEWNDQKQYGRLELYTAAAETVEPAKAEKPPAELSNKLAPKRATRGK